MLLLCFGLPKRKETRLQNKLLMTEIPMISYTNLDHYYAELFIPLEEEDQLALTNPSAAGTVGFPCALISSNRSSSI